METHGRGRFRNSTSSTKYEMCISFLFLHWKKKFQHIKDFLGTCYLTLPEMKKRTLKGKRSGNPICRCYISSHVTENFIAVKGIKKKVSTDAICQPLQQILLYIKQNDVFEMQLFQKPQDSALRDVQKSSFHASWNASAVYFSS